AIVDLAPFAENDHRAVVHGVMEGGSRQDEAVEQRDGDAGVDAVFERAQHAAGGGAVEVKRVAHAGVDGGDDVRLPVDDEAGVADVRLVEDGVDGLAVVDSAGGEAADGGARRLQRATLF